MNLTHREIVMFRKVRDKKIMAHFAFVQFLTSSTGK